MTQAPDRRPDSTLGDGNPSEIQNRGVPSDVEISQADEPAKPTVDRTVFEVTHSSFSHGVTTKAGRLGKSTGRWTKREHFLFVEGMNHLIVGLRIFHKNWKRVEVLLPT